MKIVSIVGSLRQDSWNHRLSRAATEVLKSKGVEVEEASLAGLSLFNGDLDDGTFPEPVAALRDAMRAADGLLLACPEYNHSYTGGDEERHRVDLPSAQLAGPTRWSLEWAPRRAGRVGYGCTCTCPIVSSAKGRG